MSLSSVQNVVLCMTEHSVALGTFNKMDITQGGLL